MTQTQTPNDWPACRCGYSDEDCCAPECHSYSEGIITRVLTTIRQDCHLYLRPSPSRPSRARINTYLSIAPRWMIVADGLLTIISIAAIVVGVYALIT